MMIVHKNVNTFVKCLVCICAVAVLIAGCRKKSTPSPMPGYVDSIIAIRNWTGYFSKIAYNDSTSGVNILYNIYTADTTVSITKSGDSLLSTPIISGNLKLASIDSIHQVVTYNSNTSATIASLMYYYAADSMVLSSQTVTGNISTSYILEQVLLYSKR